MSERPSAIRPKVWLGSGVLVFIAYFAVSVIVRNDDSEAPAGPSASATEADATDPDSVSDAVLRSADDRSAVDRSADGSSSGDGQPDSALAVELADASPSWRASSLVIAIQRNGYLCEAATSVESVGTVPVGWRVECPGGFAYAVSVGEDETLEVVPTPFTMDGTRVEGIRAPVFTPPSNNSEELRR